MSENPYAAPSAPLEPARTDGDRSPLAWQATRRTSLSRGGSWLFQSWPMFRASPLAWVLAVVIFIVLSMVLQFIPLIGFIALTAISPVLMAGFMYGCAAQDRGEPFTVEHLFSAFSDGKLVTYLLLALLQLVIIIVIMMTIGGIVFASVGMDAMLSGAASGEEFVPSFSPLVIVAMVVGFFLFVPMMGLYYYAPALIALGDLDLVGAIKHSVIGAVINFFPLLLFAVIAMVASLIAMIPLGLGLLVLMPMCIIAIFLSYQDIYTGQ